MAGDDFTRPGDRERRRLAALASYDILDTPRERDFDDIAVLASEICDVPIAVVNLIGEDRQWFKAEVGLGVRETPLETSFCGHAILEQDFMLVEDATEDPRFACNPLVAGPPGLRFYAGALIKTKEGLPLGTLCVLDVKPRSLSERQTNTLKRLARQAMSQLELRLALRERARSESDLRLMLDSINEGFYSVDPGGRTTSCNRAFLELLGFSEAHEVIGRSLHGIIHHSHPGGASYDEADCPIYLCARTGVAAHVSDEVFYRRDGSALPVEYRVHPIFRDDALQGAICTFVDVTERRRTDAALRDFHAHLEERVADVIAARQRTEEQLRQSQKLEAIGQLTGGVAHDFNNFLTVIRGSVDLLRRPDISEARRDRYVEAIADTVTRATNLTGQLLAFARRQTLTPVVFDVSRNLTGLGEMLSTLTGSRIRIVIDAPGEACLVKADANQFDTALINMAVNARDAMNGEGLLTISLRIADAIPATASSAAVSGGFIAVSLADTGSGIPPDKRQEIFEPFFTTKAVGQGTGLGLSQVFGFAKQSGGEVHVASEIGQGSVFTLYLPRAAPDEVAADATPRSDDLIHGQGARVLVVEDNAQVGSFATQRLNELGFTTHLASNADEALAQLAKDVARFDIVFSDVVMPGMSGLDLGQEIRRLYPDLPVVLASGYSQVLAENGTLGFELLKKPYSIEQLSRVLHLAAMPRAAPTAQAGEAR